MVDVVTSNVATYTADSLTDAMADGELLEGDQMSQILSDLRSINSAIYGSTLITELDVTNMMLAGALETHASADADDLVIGDRTQVTNSYGITINSGGTSGSSYVNFGDTGSNNTGSIRYRHATDYFQITAGATNMLRITATEISGHVDGSTDCGRTGLRWGTTWTDALVVTNTGTFGTTLGVTGLVTMSAAATVGTTLLVSGDTELDGALNHDGSTIGFYGTTPAAQSSAYTRNATIVVDRTLLANASASTANNNSVLAALIIDLQTIGLIQ